MERKALIKRVTGETNIELELVIDGTGKCEAHTGIGFFDHMLNSFARHGLFDIRLDADGDLYVDGHHTVEDIGIVLGMAIKEAIGDKKGIKRYGSFILPMDESLVMCAVDLSGRPYYANDFHFNIERLAEFDTELVNEFFHAVTYSAGMNLHFKQMSGGNTHHVIEAAFKAFAKSLDIATQYDERITDVLSTKGML